MFTFIILLSIVVIIVASIFMARFYDKAEYLIGHIFSIILIISTLSFFWSLFSWFDRGDIIKAKLQNNPDVVFFDNAPSVDLMRLLPKLKEKTIVIPDGKDIKYYEIIK